MLFCVCYDLRPGILSKRKKWVRQQGIYLSPVAFLLPSSPNSWLQIPQPTSHWDYQTQDNWWGQELELTLEVGGWNEETG